MEQFKTDDIIVTNEAEDAASAKKAAEAQKKQELKEAMNLTITTDETYKARLHRLSDSLEVVNTFGFGDDGNIVKKGTKDNGKNNLVNISKTVGYSVRNIGEETVTYKTCKYAADEQGVYVGTEVTLELKPGETCILARRYMTEFCAQPEISFTLSNGKLKASSAKGKKELAEELASYYFAFDKADDKNTAKSVNDDEIKVRIDKDNKVLDEYVEVFGFLNNAPAPKAGKGKSKGDKQLTAQDYAANYINRLIQESNI